MIWYHDFITNNSSFSHIHKSLLLLRTQLNELTQVSIIRRKYTLKLVTLTLLDLTFKAAKSKSPELSTLIETTKQRYSLQTIFPNYENDKSGHRAKF